MQNLKLFVTGHKGFETPLFHELRNILGSSAAVLSKKYGGVEINAGIDAAYQVCLHSRLGNRVFCEIAQLPVEDETQLYQAVHQIPWESHFSARNSIAVSATLSRSKLNHSHFVALKAKDAIVDRLREICGSRPIVEKNQPDIQIHINVHHNQASISLDLSGESLHRRGYRLEHSGAPLKEHLAAALLVQAGWDGSRGGCLIDPMCGSGTFAIEAAMISAGMAPGLKREYYGFKKWLFHQPELWQQCLQQAQEAVRKPDEILIYAADYDAKALETARANASRAGVLELIEFSHQQLSDLEKPAMAFSTSSESLVICNPPYGKRLQSEQGLAQLYTDLGDASQRLAPARLAIISANPDLLHRLKLKRISRKNVRNGPIECLFAIFETVEGKQANAISEHDIDTRPRAAVDEIAIPLRNRLNKNSKHLQRWAKNNGISCYRVYDADLPEFSFALDRYQSEIAPEVVWFHLQEYQAPATIDKKKAEHRIRVAVDVIKDLFSIPDEQLFCKTRRRQRGTEQYQKQDSQNEFYQVREASASLLINLSDYLDSGLFLDHRITRDIIYRGAHDKSVLNLFCYTGSIGVQAGLGGASSVLNVDLSANYLKWAQENHRLNGLDDEARYRFLRADIIELLDHPDRYSIAADFDLIFLDPPSFSNSSKMQQTLDIQRDHSALIGQAMKLLTGNGMLLFSTNRRGFKLDDDILQCHEVRDISHQTLPEDFKRNPKIHRCWEIGHKI